MADFSSTYNTIRSVNSKIMWEKYIYDSKTMGNFDNHLDCSFLCKNVEKDNACDLFTIENGICYFGKASHTAGEVEFELADATIYITDGKIFAQIKEFLLSNIQAKNILKLLHSGPDWIKSIFRFDYAFAF